MHRIFEVNYDLRAQPKPNYTGLYEDLKQFPGWIHVMDSVWFVYTDMEAIDVYSRISRYLHRNDYAWVNEVGANYYGWLPKSAWDWLGKAKQQASKDNAFAISKVLA